MFMDQYTFFSLNNSKLTKQGHMDTKHKFLEVFDSFREREREVPGTSLFLITNLSALYMI